MNKRTVGLIIVLLLIGIGYLALFNSRREVPIQAMYVEMPGSVPMFSFNDEVTFKEVKVIRPAVEPAEGELYIAPEDEVVWHLIPREAKEGEDAVELPMGKLLKYGRGKRGLRRAEGMPKDAAALEPGVEYQFTAELAEGVVELTFTPKAKG